MNMIMHVLPLLVFTTFAGLAAGAYAVDALAGNGAKTAVGRPAWLFPVVCVVLLGIGLCGTLAHLGQPLRFVNGLSNPASGISQEAYWSIALGVVIVVDAGLAKAKGLSVRPVRWLGGVVAAGLMVVTGLAYFDCLGLPAWSGAVTVPVFVVGDMALGAGLCALLSGEGLASKAFAAANVAAQVAWAAVIVAYGLHLARLGVDYAALLGAAVVLGPVAVCACALATHAGKVPVRVGAACVCALAFVSVVCVRYAFFAAGMGA